MVKNCFGNFFESEYFLFFDSPKMPSIFDQFKKIGVTPTLFSPYLHLHCILNGTACLRLIKHLCDFDGILLLNGNA